MNSLLIPLYIRWIEILVVGCDQTVATLVKNADSVFPPETSLIEAMTSLKDGLALPVVENSRPVGILTRIDVLDFLAEKI